MASPIRKTTKGKGRNYLSTKEGAGMTAAGRKAYNAKTGIYSNVGNVNFTTGTATFSVGIITSNSIVKVYGIPETLDIAATQSTILLINPSDVSIFVNQVS